MAEVFLIIGSNFGGDDLKVAILIIDMINDFVTGKLGFKQAIKIVPNIKRLVDFARSKGIQVIYICDAHDPKDHELKLWGPHALKGSEGAKVVEELKPVKQDKTLEKRTYSAFFGTKLDKTICELRVNELVLTGVVTDICIQHTAADAFFRGYRVTVPEDCTASVDEVTHRRALDYIKKIYGAKITRSSDLIKEWREGA